MFKKIAAGIAVLIVVFLIVVSMQSSTFHVERSVTISAKREIVFPFLNNLKKSNEWSPWQKLDPQMKLSYEGPAEGPGAAFHWSGNDQAGEGTMTILESKPNDSVRCKLDFVRPMTDTSFATFKLTPQDGATSVTWSMDGKKGFVQKAMCMFMDMDKMVGGSFEEGLNNLKLLAEKAVK